MGEENTTEMRQRSDRIGHEDGDQGFTNSLQSIGVKSVVYRPVDLPRWGDEVSAMSTAVNRPHLKESRGR